MPTETITFLGMQLIYSDDQPASSIRLESGDRFSIYTLDETNGFLTTEMLRGFRQQFISVTGIDADRLVMNPRSVSRGMADEMFAIQAIQAAAAARQTVSASEIINRAAMRNDLYGDLSIRVARSMDVEVIHQDGGMYGIPRSWSTADNDVPHFDRGYPPHQNIRGAVMRESGLHKIAVQMDWPRTVISFVEHIPSEEYSDETRRNAMKRMRLALFKYLQRNLRLQFDYHKETNPEVWQGPEEPPVPLAQAHSNTSQEGSEWAELDLEQEPQEENPWGPTLFTDRQATQPTSGIAPEQLAEQL